MAVKNDSLDGAGSMKKVAVIASLNQDITVDAPYLPAEGETILGTDLRYSLGGKGGNQTVALARLGAKVSVIANVGADSAGEQYIAALQAEGTDTSAVRVHADAPTGTALITVSTAGANTIVVVPGANSLVDFEQVLSAREAFATAAVVLAQMETPLAATQLAFSIARESARVTVLNPAPAIPFKQLRDLLTVTDVLVPNEVEFEEIFGVAPLRQVDGPGASADGPATVANGPATVAKTAALAACQPAFEAGVKWVVVTLGGLGQLVLSTTEATHIEARPVRVVDTTAAGDSFVAGLVAALAEAGDTSAETILAGCALGAKVASLTVQRPGAHNALPTAEDVAQG